MDMKTVSLISFIRNSVEDDYAMKVFYNIVKDSFVNNAAFLNSWGQVPGIQVPICQGT